MCVWVCVWVPPVATRVNSGLPPSLPSPGPFVFGSRPARGTDLQTAGPIRKPRKCFEHFRHAAWNPCTSADGSKRGKAVQAVSRAPREDFLFGNALMVPGFQHRIDNLVKKVCNTMPCFPRFLEQLKVVWESRQVAGCSDTRISIVCGHGFSMRQPKSEPRCNFMHTGHHSIHALQQQPLNFGKSKSQARQASRNRS